MLPLLISGKRNDLARAVLQGRSLGHFFRRTELLRVSVVGRADELPQIADALKPLETPWLQYNLIDEATIHPGLPASKVEGWYKQQIIKMAAPEWLGANFWMTLDADVVCTKLIGIDDLLPSGRALLWVDGVAVPPPPSDRSPCPGWSSSELAFLLPEGLHFRAPELHAQHRRQAIGKRCAMRRIRRGRRPPSTTQHRLPIATTPIGPRTVKTP